MIAARPHGAPDGSPVCTALAQAPEARWQRCRSDLRGRLPSEHALCPGAIGGTTGRLHGPSGERAVSGGAHRARDSDARTPDGRWDRGTTRDLRVSGGRYPWCWRRPSMDGQGGRGRSWPRDRHGSKTWASGWPRLSVGVRRGPASMPQRSA
jgi:hypothetical protein